MADYYEIFMTQFVTTLAQLTAGILSASIAVPVYSYYTRGTFTLSEHYEVYNNEIHNTDSDSEITQTEDDETDESINNVSNEVHLSNDDN